MGLEKRTTDVASSATASATTLTVDSTEGFEDNGFLRIGTEVIAYTGKTATTFTGLTRGAAGTTAIAHSVDCLLYTSDAADE